MEVAIAVSNSNEYVFVVSHLMFNHIHAIHHMWLMKEERGHQPKKQPLPITKTSCLRQHGFFGGAVGRASA